MLRGDYGTITVGARTSVQDGAVIHATAELSTVIGDDCVVGHLAHLEGCVIENGCLIGSGSIVLHEASVHTGALVGAGAVVSGGTDVPSAPWPSASRRKSGRTPCLRVPSPRTSRCMSPMATATVARHAASTDPDPANPKNDAFTLSHGTNSAVMLWIDAGRYWLATTKPALQRGPEGKSVKNRVHLDLQPLRAVGTTRSGDLSTTVPPRSPTIAEYTAPVPAGLFSPTLKPTSFASCEVRPNGHSRRHSGRAPSLRTRNSSFHSLSGEIVPGERVNASFLGLGPGVDVGKERLERARQLRTGCHHRTVAPLSDDGARLAGDEGAGGQVPRLQTAFEEPIDAPGGHRAQVDGGEHPSVGCRGPGLPAGRPRRPVACAPPRRTRIRWPPTPGRGRCTPTAAGPAVHRSRRARHPHRDRPRTASRWSAP